MGRVQLGVGRGLLLLRVRSSRTDEARGSWGARCAACGDMSCTQRNSRGGSERGRPGGGGEAEEGGGRHGQLLTLPARFELCHYALGQTRTVSGPVPANLRNSYISCIYYNASIHFSGILLQHHTHALSTLFLCEVPPPSSA